MEPVDRFVAGIDVHKEMLAVVVGREQEGEIKYEEWKFRTTRAEILHLGAWLQHERVGEVFPACQKKLVV